MLPSVQNFLDTMQLGTPHFAHIVESAFALI
jgi:hypothetical protein